MTAAPGIDAATREAVVALAHDAAAAILAIYDSEFAVEHKDDDSPLTAADMAAHRCIVDGLARITPDIPVLSEESAHEVATGLRRSWRRLWIVDPLDGTREFVKRNGEFTVNIALVEDGVAVFGVVQAPVTGVTWHGGAALGALRREGGREQPLHVRAPATAPLRVAASRSHRDTRTQAFIDRMGDVEPVGLGSSLKFCRIAGPPCVACQRCPVTGACTTPKIATPSSISARFTVNSPLRLTNSRVPSSGSTSHRRRHSRRTFQVASSEASSDNTGMSGVRRSRPSTRMRCAARSAAVSGLASALRSTSKACS